MTEDDRALSIAVNEVRPGDVVEIEPTVEAALRNAGVTTPPTERRHNPVPWRQL